LYSDPGLDYFEDLSKKTDFIRDTLEKPYRLISILKDVSATGSLRSKLALKGGTAIQFIHMGIGRLSVDVDFNYVGSTDKGVMEAERTVIRDELSKILQEHGYQFQGPRMRFSEEQFELKYINAIGNVDWLKVEINYSERLPVLDLKTMRLTHPFNVLGDVATESYVYEEVMAQKVRALVDRGTARDLFDVHQFLKKAHVDDRRLFRKLFLFYMCLNKPDVRKVNDEKIRAITKMDVKQWLVPLLRRQDHGIDLEAMRVPVLEFVKELLDFEKDERRFLDKFYDDGVFDQGLLFGDIRVKNDLSTHPMVQWRLSNIKEG
jgi:predicted nucleotidyltransferase component of viral defense system